MQILELSSLDEAFITDYHNLTNHSDAPLYIAVFKDSPDDYVVLKCVQNPNTYEKVCEKIWSPYLESVFGLIKVDSKYFAVDEAIKRPKAFKYSEDMDFVSISLAQLVESGENSFHDIVSEANTSDNKNKKCPYFSETHALVIAYEICSGIIELEEHGISHKDLAPQNILFTDCPEWLKKIDPIAGMLPFQIKIIDYGESGNIKEELHKVTTVVKATRGFYASERENGTISEYWVDMKSIGSLIYYLCFGHYMGANQNDRFNALGRVSEQTFHIIKTCTREDPEQRYLTYRGLRTAIVHAIRYNTSCWWKIFYHIPGFRSGRIRDIAMSIAFYFITLFIILVLADSLTMWKIMPLIYLYFFSIVDALNIRHNIMAKILQKDGSAARKLRGILSTRRKRKMLYAVFSITCAAIATIIYLTLIMFL